MNTDAQFVDSERLEAGLELIRQSPKISGELVLVVRRPQVGEREPIEEGELSLGQGLIGDNWGGRGSSSTPDGRPNPAMQLTLMNARAIALIAQDRARWPLAGDQLFVDLDLSMANLPPGSRIAIGPAVVEVSPQPHLGCKKFLARFGLDALNFVNSGVGKELRLRGLNARIITPGRVRVGDVAKKI